ncbi:MAG: FtsX-like permease family protein, partial [Bacteroidota bacterium]
QSEAGAGIYVYGPAAYAEQARDRELEYARTASLLAMVVGLAIVLAVVTLDWLDFTLRLPEQVLLQLVGWKRWHLMLRSLLEAVLRGAAGWLCGLLLGFLILQMLRRQVFAPRGMDLLWRRQDLLITMSLPILAAAASLILRLFTTVYDPVFGGKKARQRTMV